MIKLKKAESSANKALLIINPSAGSIRNDPEKINDIIYRLKDKNFEPVASPDAKVERPCFGRVGHQERYSLIAVRRRRDSICSVKSSRGLRAALGILPLGTQNNIAVSLASLLP